MTVKPPLQFPPGCRIFAPLYADPEYRFATAKLQESGSLILEELRVVLPTQYTTSGRNDGQYQVEIPYAVRVGGQHRIKIRTETWSPDGSRVAGENANDRDLKDSERTAKFNVPTLATSGSSIVIRTVQQTLVLENETVPAFPTERVTATYRQGSFTLLDTAGVEVIPRDQGADAFPAFVVSDRKYIVPFFQIAFSNETLIVILNKNSP